MVRVAALISILLIIPACTGFTPNMPGRAANLSIVGDADLMTQAAAHGWSGSGSASDPIRIEGLALTVSSGDAFAIEDVMLHFLIINGTFTGPGQFDPLAGIGVRLVATPNGAVEQSNATGFATGIYASAFGMTLSQNNLSANRIGALLEAGTTTIQDNLIQDGETGIIVAGGAATITGNTAQNNTGRGIQISGTSGTRVEGNIVTGNGDVGVYVFDSNFVDVVGNTVSNNGADGVQFLGGGSSQNTGHVLAQNILADNGRYGVLVSNSPSALAWGIHRGMAIHANEFSGHATGLQLASTRLVTVSSNAISGNDVGMRAVDGGANTIRLNTIADNNRGLSLQGSVGNDIKRNELLNNTVGMELGGAATANVIVDNVFDNARNTRIRDVAPNFWFLPKRPGTNVAGGEWQGGNLWSDYAGVDRNGDGLGEEPYRVDSKAWAVDAHPLV